MKIVKSVYEEILRSTPEPPPESGGILGEKNHIVSAFYKDMGINTGRIDHYVPDVAALNYVIEEWREEQTRFCGIYHTHYPGNISLSRGDITYIESIIKAFQPLTDKLYFPLVFPRDEILAFQACICRDEVTISQENIIIINEKEKRL